MMRLAPVAMLLLSGCIETPASVGGPPSIQAGIWPWFYSSTPRHRGMIHGEQETRRDLIFPPPAKPGEAAAQPDNRQLSVDKIDEARQRLLDIQQRLNRPAPRGERLNE